MEKEKIIQEWWLNLSSYTKQLFQKRYYPATNWLYLSSEMITSIYEKEKQN
jgi:hypothetical protein